jgi:peptidoglycan/LPS O-acetylase OafA/YrhL
VLQQRRNRSGGSAAPPGGVRLTALDGLRGLAALVVVIHHGLLTWPVLADQYLVANRASGSWWLAFTPLHLAWAGTEAVTVFFVLSGLVLVLPFLDRPAGAAGWRDYYGRRLVRLYVPVVVAVVLAALLVRLFPRVPGPTTSWWFDWHGVPADLAAVANDLQLVRDGSRLNSVLWSLKYEVLFSLLLPLYVVVVRRVRGRVLLLSLVLLALSWLGASITSPSLAWLPVFGIGACIAASRARLMALGSAIERRRHAPLIWATLGAVTVVLLLAEWWVRALHAPTVPALAMAHPLVVAGAALVCVLVMICPAVRRLCDRRPVRRLGVLSFSLYLVHEPIVVSVSSLVGGSRRGVAITLVVGLLLSLVAAALFHRVVEAPSQRLAATVGRALGGRRDSGRPRHPVAEAHGRRPLPPVPPPRVRVGGPVGDGARVTVAVSGAAVTRPVAVPAPAGRPSA